MYIPNIKTNITSKTLTFTSFPNRFKFKIKGVLMFRGVHYFCLEMDLQTSKTTEENKKVS